jgi:serine protease Do
VKNLLLAFLFFLLLAGCAPQLPPVYQPSLPTLDSVVALVDDEGEPYCTGVVTPEGILTAEHCVTDESSVNIGFYHNVHLEDRRFVVFYTVPVLRTSPECDLAVLHRPIRADVASPIARRPVVHGEPVWVVGMPLGLPYTTHPGVISGVTRGGDGERLPARWFQVSAGIFPGNSGGPVFSADGQVLGIVSFGVTMNGTFLGHLGMAVPVDSLEGCFE